MRSSTLLLLMLCAAVSAHTNRSTLRVFDLRAEDLPGDFLGLDPTDAYVKVFYQSSLMGETVVRENDDPWWEEEFTHSAEKNFSLKLEVHDEDWGPDDLVGTCVTEIREKTPRDKCVIHKDKCDLKKGGKLYYKYTLW